jgi:AcrR family transcriptional regulator
MQMTSKVGRRPADKFDERRRELAESALVTLGELGYARTSLREIASNSEFSHGVLHYYFSDKLELIVFCVRYYKARCVHRYDGVVEQSTTAQELLDGFAAKLAETIVEEAPMHRLWYDLRSQSMFEQTLREAVTAIDRTLEEMVWRVITRYAELLGTPVSTTSALAYGLLDGPSSRPCSATRPATRPRSSVCRTRCTRLWRCCSGTRSPPEPGVLISASSR